MAVNQYLKKKKIQSFLIFQGLSYVFFYNKIEESTSMTWKWIKPYVGSSKQW